MCPFESDRKTSWDPVFWRNWLRRLIRGIKYRLIRRAKFSDWPPFCSKKSRERKKERVKLSEKKVSRPGRVCYIEDRKNLFDIISSGYLLLGFVCEFVYCRSSSSLLALSQCECVYGQHIFPFLDSRGKKKCTWSEQVVSSSLFVLRRRRRVRAFSIVFQPIVSWVPFRCLLLLLLPLLCPIKFISGRH